LATQLIKIMPTFQNHPDIFPIVYKVTDKYAVLGKLNTEKAINDLTKLESEFLI
jgi:hypothetical protein